MLRVALHGFTTLEAAGGFGLPQSVDATFTRLVDALDATFTSWAGQHRRNPSYGHPAATWLSDAR